MRIRLLAAGFILLTAATLHAEPPKPNVVLQAKPIDEWLADAKQVAQQLGPLLEGIGGPPPKPGEAPKPKPAAAQIDDAIAGVLGPNWREALDTTKPFGGYALIKDEFTDGTVVALLPVKDVKVLLGALGNFGLMPEEKDGPYTVKVSDTFTAYARAANGYMYVGMSAESVAKENLLAPDTVFAAKDPSSLVVRVRLDAVSETWKKKALEEIDQAGPAALAGQSEAAAKVMKDTVASFKRVITDGREWTIGLDFDRKTGEVAIVSEIIPKPGTPLADEYKKAAPTTSRFAGLAKDALAFLGLTYEIPTIGEALAKDLDKSLAETHKGLADANIKVDKEALEKLVRAAMASLDVGKTDAGLAVYPGSDKTVGVVYGLAIKDGEKLDRALADFVKSAPEELKQVVKLNAGKLGAANLHRIDAGKIAPEEVRKIFGTAEGVVAIGPDAFWVGLGAGAEERIKAAMQSGPQPAAMAVLELSLQNLWPIVEQLADAKNREQIKKVRDALGKDLDRVRLFRLARTPGESMKYRLGVDLLAFARLASVAQMAEGKASSPEPAKPKADPGKPPAAPKKDG